MSGRLLTFSQYLGGADNVKVIEMFPTTSKTFKYEFGSDVSGWTFTTHYQTLLLDKLTYDRITGEPNFTDTNIMGYWPERTDLGGSSDITINNVSAGEVFLNIAPSRYTGQLFPNARENVVLTVVSLTWNMTSSEPGAPGTTESHRWGIIERYLPGNPIPGDPALDALYIPYGTGAVSSYNVVYTGNPSGYPNFIFDQQFNYTDSGQAGSTGTGLSIGLTWIDGMPNVEYGLLATGSGYRPTETIRISDEELGNGGSGETVITITATG